MMVAFGPAMPVVHVLVVQQQFAVGIESGGKRPGPRHARVIIGAVPRGHGGVNVRVRRVGSELLLNHAEPILRSISTAKSALGE